MADGRSTTRSARGTFNGSNVSPLPSASASPAAFALRLRYNFSFFRMPMTHAVHMEDAHAALSKFFGFEGFREGQGEVVESILAGHDTVVVMPTGGGKSLCFQLPALMRDGVTVVVSPLIALMKDQVDALHARGLARDLHQQLARLRGAEGAHRGRAPRRLQAPLRRARTLPQQPLRRDLEERQHLALRRGRGALHLRMGSRFSSRLPSSTVLPRGDRAPADRRAHGDGHALRPRRHHRAAQARRPARLRQRLRPPQPLARRRPHREGAREVRAHQTAGARVRGAVRHRLHLDAQVGRADHAQAPGRAALASSATTPG